jgi:hypothetical protein
VEDKELVAGTGMVTGEGLVERGVGGGGGGGGGGYGAGGGGGPRKETTRQGREPRRRQGREPRRPFPIGTLVYRILLLCLP